eukprot:TRINITY_DN2973_c1_g1_i1.p1 TRINITY_DN2973_c1_g1~~TRINITY_DN2973_c1_g1_i1.p1  ORF type:complete len:1097 (+),score=423.84 TRINITY_DN2973_c1_g1_i1:67-3357(+)
MYQRAAATAPSLGRTHSPRRAPLGEADARALLAQLKEERRDRAAKDRAAEVERVAAARKLEELQTAVADFQVVLASHEREVEALWAQGGPGKGGGGAGEDAELRQDVARLTARVDALQKNQLSGGAGRENIQASTLELLFAQNRELMDELEERVRNTHDAATRESARVESQLAALREAVQLGERQRDSTHRDVESRCKQLVSELRGEAAAAWDCFAAGLASPATVPAADGAAMSRVCALRDAIIALVTARVGACADALHREQQDRGRHHDTSFGKLQQQIGKQQQNIDKLHAEVREMSARPSGVDAAAEVAGQLSLLSGTVDQHLSQLAATRSQIAADQSEIGSRISQLSSDVDAMSQRLANADSMKLLHDRAMTDVGGLVTTHKEEVARITSDARQAAKVAQEQFNTALQRHRDETRGQLQRSQEEARQQAQAVTERTADFSRQIDVYRVSLEEQAAALKRLSTAQHEAEAQRKDETWRQQQQQSEALSRAQQQLQEDIHRVQRETKQELQRHDDGATNLYRIVEELRAVQQRTLDEYHRQGDEHAQIAARMQQQLMEAATSLKEASETEVERVSGLLRGEASNVADSLARTRLELQERMSSAERRLQDTEAGMDGFRGRLRVIENGAHDSMQTQKVIEDHRQRLQLAESKMQALDRWKGEASAQLLSLDGRVSEAGKQGQLTQLSMRVDEMERGLLSARGAERDALIRQVRGELEEKLASAETRIDKNTSQLQLEQQEHENVLKEIQRDITRDEVQLRQTQDRIKALEIGLQQQVRKMQESIARELQPSIDGCHNKIVQVEAAVEEFGGKQGRLAEEVKRNKTSDERRSEQLQGMVGEAQRAAQAVTREFEESRETLRASIARLEAEKAEMQRTLSQVEAQARAAASRDDLGTMKDSMDALLARQASEIMRSGRQLEETQHAVAAAATEIQRIRADLERRAGDHLFQIVQQRLDSFANELARMGQELEKVGAVDSERVNEIHKAMLAAEESKATLAQQVRDLESSTEDSFRDQELEGTRIKDKLRSLEASFQELDGFVQQMAQGSDGPVAALQGRIRALEAEMQTELQRARRAIEASAKDDLSRGESAVSASAT